MISALGVSLLKLFEGFSPKPYKDAAGKWTIGYGHLILDDESFPDPLDEPAAQTLLTLDLAKAEASLIHVVDLRATLTSFQRESLTSFVYNLGGEALKHSTLLNLLVLGNAKLAAWEFEKWCKATDPKTGEKVTVGGLLRRRLAEQAWFLGGSEALIRRAYEGR